MLTPKKAATIIRQRGYRLTPQRRAVLNVIAATHDPLDPAEVHKRVRLQYPSMGLVTVYRTLGILVELGLMCEVHSSGNCRSYLMRRPQEHHHHLVCSDCGAVADFTDCELGELEERVSRQTGFEIEGHLLEFSGRCRSCQATAREEARP
jgi:Fur family ferric uptake transcriptional regulator